jgi:hypothetical protein
VQPLYAMTMARSCFRGYIYFRGSSAGLEAQPAEPDTMKHDCNHNSPSSEPAPARTVSHSIAALEAMVFNLYSSKQPSWNSDQTSGKEAPKRTRASRPKVRTGCATCKQRHVKCDERKPTCERCERAGTKCDGYGTPPRPPAERAPKPRQSPVRMLRELLPREDRQIIAPPSPGDAPPCPPLLSRSELQYVDCFRFRLMNDFAAFCNPRAWRNLMFQKGLQDECTRNAILATGAMTQALQQESQSRSAAGEHNSRRSGKASALPGHTLNVHHERALQYHLKATTLFRQRIETEPETISPLTMLMTTVLLTAHELVQGNGRAAERLLNSGMALTRDSLRLHPSGSFDGVDLVESLLSRLSVGFVQSRCRAEELAMTSRETSEDLEIDPRLRSVDDETGSESYQRRGQESSPESRTAYI